MPSHDARIPFSIRFTYCRMESIAPAMISGAHLFCAQVELVGLRGVWTEIAAGATVQPAT